MQTAYIASACQKIESSGVRTGLSIRAKRLDSKSIMHQEFTQIA